MKKELGDIVELHGKKYKVVNNETKDKSKHPRLSKTDLFGQSLEGDTWLSDIHSHRVVLVEKAKEIQDVQEGGPSNYYDMPYQDWVTVNDQMEYLADKKWGNLGIHLKEIFKATCRWGDKEGTTREYDARKIIYYGVRTLRLIVGTTKTRDYLQSLLDHPQFKEKK